MIQRPFWVERVRAGWAQRPIVWLSGVRRVGKTTLSRMFPEADYRNCDRPSTARALADPESFLAAQPAGATLVLDELQRLPDPSLVLKIAADEFPGLRLLATGSSTLAATRKFRDSLTGRKEAVPLSPILWEECSEPFGVPDLDRRLLAGGLPEFLLADERDPSRYREWLDSFYARDVLELFPIRDRRGFLALFELVLRQSGGLLDLGRLAGMAEISRPTARKYLEVLETAHAIRLLRPFSGGGSREIVARPKAYAFDTGFVTFERGWDTIREEDRGVLWEHLVLDSLLFRVFPNDLFYWRDKSGRELDFVIRRDRDRLDVVECRINPDEFRPRALDAFRNVYPEGENFVVGPFVGEPWRMRRGRHRITVCTPRFVEGRAAVAWN